MIQLSCCTLITTILFSGLALAQVEPEFHSMNDNRHPHYSAKFQGKTYLSGYLQHPNGSQAAIAVQEQGNNAQTVFARLSKDKSVLVAVYPKITSLTLGGSEQLFIYGPDFDAINNDFAVNDLAIYDGNSISTLIYPNNDDADLADQRGKITTHIDAVAQYADGVVLARNSSWSDMEPGQEPGTCYQITFYYLDAKDAVEQIGQTNIDCAPCMRVSRSFFDCSGVPQQYITGMRYQLTKSLSTEGQRLLIVTGRFDQINGIAAKRIETDNLGPSYNYLTWNGSAWRQ